MDFWQVEKPRRCVLHDVATEPLKITRCSKAGAKIATRSRGERAMLYLISGLVRVSPTCTHKWVEVLIHEVPNLKYDMNLIFRRLATTSCLQVAEKESDSLVIQNMPAAA